MNYYIRENFSVEQLREEVKKLEEDVRQLGQVFKVYHGNLTEFQKQALNSHEAGHEIDAQIYETYAEMGAVLQALTHHGAIL